MAAFMGDLDSNFDNIIPAMTNIICQKKGLPKSACIARALPMENLVRCVRTAWGTSTRSYITPTNGDKLPGEGQGKADSMAAMALLSSILLSAHKTLCHGIEFVDPTGKLNSRRTNDMYVDDNDGYASAPSTNTTAECIENLNHHAQVWTKLIAITGGPLCFHKCYWQMLSWIAVGVFIY